LKKPSLVASLFVVSNCFFPYVYHVRDHRVLVTSIDIDATLEIATAELEDGGFDATLTLWAIRDQIVSVEQAKAISALYFKYIDRVAAEKDKGTADFGVWHLTWAIANLYRHGDAGIRTALDEAYQDARKRPDRLKTFRDIAAEHVNGEKIYMGDIHGAARAFARSHIVAPGNKKYLQSLEEYERNRPRRKS